MFDSPSPLPSLSSSSLQRKSSDRNKLSKKTLPLEDLKNSLRVTPLTNEDAAHPAEWRGKGSEDVHNSDTDDKYCVSDQSNSKSHSGAMRRRSQVTTNTQLIKKKLDQMKAAMQRLSEQHWHHRPQRKAYHPFVWNSLSAYTDTTEIDYLLSTSSRRHCREGGSLMKTERLPLPR